jgi:ribonuclease R
MKERIKNFILKNEIKKFNASALFSRMRLTRAEKAAFFLALISLVEEKFLKKKNGNFIVLRQKGILAVIDRMNGTFAFAKGENGEEYFIPGSYLNGAITGDKVILNPLSGEGETDSARVLKVIEFGDRLFSGEVAEWGRLYCREFGKTTIKIQKNTAQKGDKVLFRVVGRKRDELIAKIEENFGAFISAATASEMYILEKEIPYEFSEKQLSEAARIAEEGLSFEGRVDLRSEKIFTIDSASSKDLDDAVSLERAEDGFILKVSIADVSHYIKRDSLLDKEAFNRGTSVYYADKVIPMLPKEISNGICSLSEGKDRCAFTCEAHLSDTGEILGYKFYKSLICSAVKGVYSEINDLLGGTSDESIEKKYLSVKNQLALMEELYNILKKKREERSVVDFETAESYFSLDEEGRVSEIYPRERGVSECIIEEFMIIANRCAGQFAKENGLPFLYRVHESPSIEKTDELKAMLNLLGIKVSPTLNLMTNEGMRELYDLIKDKPESAILEKQMLRSMAKARYDYKNIGHFGLNLDIYSHFTSPIRRYSDLSIHRIMSDCLEFGSDSARRKYTAFSEISAEQSSITERRAVMAERDIDDKYKAEYATRHMGEEAEGIVSGVLNTGFFVLLPNTLEGFISAADLGRTSLSAGMKFIAEDLGQSFKVGDRVKIEIAGADIFSGKTNFILKE